MQTGTINVQTENILPIIKRYLYSDQEIFLRELVANAVDATQKLKTLSSKGEVKGDLGHLQIEIILDEDAKTLTISDKGIGMTKEEVEKYITQIAFSSAQEFAEKYKDSANAVIGHFGLGFYSAFMVADKVEIKTKSWKDAPAVHWLSDGSTTYEIDEIEKEERGTDIILHIEEAANEYLANNRIQELLTKYCRFLPVEIKFGTTEEKVAPPEGEEDAEPEVHILDNIINNTDPLWKKKPNELTDEDYMSFYRQLYPYGEEPLFWIHLNVDHPFQLTGILYFPKIRNNNFEVRKDRISLYCNQVFVTDQVEQIVPDFLMLLHGVIDSPDIPLNVSRSYLQADPEVKKINKYITRKVADKLDEMFRKDRELFNEKWEHTGVLIKYGMLTEDKFYDKAKKFCLLETTEGGLHTFEEFEELVKPNQTDKNDKLIYIYTNGGDSQHGYVEAAKEKGYQVLKFDAMLDPHFIGKLEGQLENIQFKRVDADTLDQLIEKDENYESVLSEDQETKLKDIFLDTVENQQISVTLKPLTPQDKPLVITRPEFIRRMKDMSNIGGASPYGDMPDMYNVVVNTNHPVISKLLAKRKKENQEHIAKQLYDLALLQQNMLTGAKLTEFINRSVNLMDK